MGERFLVGFAFVFGQLAGALVQLAGHLEGFLLRTAYRCEHGGDVLPRLNLGGLERDRRRRRLL